MMSALQDKNNPLYFYQMPAKKRLDFIINHPTPLKLVREMPTAELLLIIREVGTESSLELIPMMHPEQIQELFDFEVWTFDELNPRALAHYFAVLFEADQEIAVSQIYNLDIELLGVIFKMAAKIYDLTAGEEPEDYSELFSKSPDNRFLICFADDQELSDLGQMLHTFLEQLYSRDMSFALSLLENIRFELVSGLEESCQKWRQNRLLDLGILPREERLQFFSSIPTAKMKNLSRATHDDSRHKSAQTVLPLALVQTSLDSLDTPFLEIALKHSTHETKEAFWHSFIFATNNMHASLSGDFGDRHAMIETSNYVKFLIEAGLFHICQGKSDDTGLMLDKYPVKTLIRLGRTLLTNLRKRLQNSDTLLLGKDFCHLDSPLRETAKALLLPEPRFYEGQSSVKKLAVRYFRNLHELHITLTAVNEIIFRARFCGQAGLGITAQALPLTHTNMLGRALINGYLKKDRSLSEITVNDLHQVFNGVDLHEHFVNFANNYIDEIVRSSACDVDKAHNFKNAVLIQLTQNRALILE